MEHYKKNDIEPIEYIKSLGILEPFCVGNIIKYVSRYKHKGGVEDLNKAKIYLGWLIDEVSLKEESTIEGWRARINNSNMVEFKPPKEETSPDLERLKGKVGQTLDKVLKEGNSYHPLEKQLSMLLELYDLKYKDCVYSEVKKEDGCIKLYSYKHDMYWRPFKFEHASIFTITLIEKEQDE